MKINQILERKKITRKQDEIRDLFENKRVVEVIPSKENKQENSNFKKRVAAYCRVSTYAETQSGSFELQIQAYREKILKHPDWELVDIYADQGVSGTSMKKRDHFNRMLADCRLGKIDLIIVKSISRFSRNTLDFISVYRELKAFPIPIGILIEDLNLNTLDRTSETILVMFSIIAQGESEQKSEAITWSIIERFKKGLPIIPTHNLLGFYKDKFGQIQIEETEAEVVRLIYRNFLNGVRAQDIAEILMNSHIPTAIGNEKWNASSIYRILRNEKYCGDVLMQKTFTVDCFSHQSKKNKGEKPKYLLRNGIPKIISRKEWIKTQELLKNPCKGKKKKIETIEKPKFYVLKIKSGMFKNFIVLDTEWSQSELEKIILEGDNTND
ncbi:MULTISPECIES: recombinase family protein [Vagococcus]|uniref:Recombinase n=1 Tax=Vagococcus fluvialis bH819 TaxID=1255619 RepID=A0A1X6WQN7_9ENTE|nr:MULTISPECIES: recombinase family protein [Vagococcus]SLM86552.1 Recombinase [Vagococcus fluvialis bH819]HCM90759.1 recombinase family protein [Vagococcus sp.]